MSKEAEAEIARDIRALYESHHAAHLAMRSNDKAARDLIEGSPASINAADLRSSMIRTILYDRPLGDLKIEAFGHYFKIGGQVYYPGEASIIKAALEREAHNSFPPCLSDDETTPLPSSGLDEAARMMVEAESLILQALALVKGSSDLIPSPELVRSLTTPRTVNAPLPPVAKLS